MRQKIIINERVIDTARNQITYKNQPQILPPKVIAVLYCLAKRQGQVVSHDEMIDEVWNSVVVSPNSLQRAIAELRKALGDDGKAQAIIKTHSKQGYSLEAEVLWSEQQTKPVIKAHTHAKKATKPVLFLAIVLFMLSLIGVFYFAKPQSEAPEFTQLTSLTASDVQEGAGVFSPDGKYLVFYRHLTYCESELWAKNLASEQSMKLTLSGAKFTGFTFSRDGEKLGFLQNRACEHEPIEYQSTEKNCWDLVAINFAEALKSPQTPHVLKACKPTKMYHPQWLTEGSFATLELQNNQLRVALHNINNHQVATLFEDKNLHLYVLRYSPTHQLLAVIGFNKEGGQVLSLLKPTGELVAQNIIDFPASFDGSSRIYPNFDPDSKRLLYGSGKSLFELDFDGSVKPITLPLYQDIYSINFHPHSNVIVGTYGTYDSDLITMPYVDGQVLGESKPSVRSIRREEQGKWSQNTAHLAFISERSGRKQVWLSSGGEPRRLTQFNGAEYPLSVEWRANENKLYVATNQGLYLYDLTGNYESLLSGHRLVGVYQSNLPTHTLLAYEEEAIVHLSTRNEDGEIEDLLKVAIQDAVLLKPHELVYQDSNGQFWHLNQGQVVALALLNQHTHKAGFVERDGRLYGLTKGNLLWRYNLKEHAYQVLKQVDNGITSISDISDTQWLFVKRISQKKEIVLIE
ncbi:winged helix-turn-helix domain-containing protein [Pseudoalteromonas luteoviolacea]|uniref:OmpR/PhoB-type domain-containing protein n=1 Tax=Pseudoalteromonas luteoviolacea S4054 TaxID=1129367 RepID=A0A0F6AAF6_9GAMM|nr:winged helix-turn-helix domain-containing protein [Pseudoalteromonas luteoviolacea]AOT10370.1 hypothetical protein S4054249_21055 [Pseudoalteromonas luteoviolacea]AOT15561.1 hypothetical protein S40542_22535 [Pseudoalteromonas luteoviolacea]AOT20188.1 hypothetical protein S4054_20970 [Pseudoalteromonas luteoviolacea]KKE83175.1 hypothetical protein N479_15450 [Pseudoalteromonas luteoviolacea S4054]KZN66697.1 hypothetical protein N481_24170 [Pseudoalteromonas luteoviolacea S4047-1]